MTKQTFDEYYARIEALGCRYGEDCGRNMMLWRYSYREGMTAHQAFYAEYPEHCDIRIETRNG